MLPIREFGEIVSHFEQTFFHSAIYSHKCAYLYFFDNTIAHWSMPVRQFCVIYKARSIHSGFYKWKTIEDNQKKFIPPLSIVVEFFHCLFANPCTM